MIIYLYDTYNLNNQLSAGAGSNFLKPLSRDNQNRIPKH